MNRIQSLLRLRGKDEVADLLSTAEASVVAWDTNTFDDDRALLEFVVTVDAYERLRNISDSSYEAILSAVRDIYPRRQGSPDIQALRFLLDPESLDGHGGSDALGGLLEAQRALLIAVATGGPRINDVNAEYVERRSHISSALAKLGLRDPIPYPDLWSWYGKWSSGDLPTYQSRREYIQGLFQPLIERLRHTPVAAGNVIDSEPTGWPLVDRQIGEMRSRLAEAKTEEQFQGVGLLCREALISLAQTVFDPSRHLTEDGVQPSRTDGKRMLAAYLAVELAGSSHEVARKHAKAALDLANDLQHRRTAIFRQAALCAEATSSVVNMIAIISGKRDP